MSLTVATTAARVALRSRAVPLTLRQPLLKQVATLEVQRLQLPLLGVAQRCFATAASSQASPNSTAEAKAAAVASGAPDVKHFMNPAKALTSMTSPAEKVQGDPEWQMPHPIWTSDSLDGVEITHEKPERFVDKAAYGAVWALRAGFDLFSGYTWKKRLGSLDERMWLRRIIFLETVAGVPGMVGGMLRHLHSLRLMRKDNGWIHTLLSEAENERMHLMIALTLRKPGPFFRTFVVFSQGLFFWTFGLIYLLSPRFCHRFVGYLEEEAVKTYSHLLEEIDAGRLPLFEHMPAPQIASQYYQLPEGAQLRDVFNCIRADESHHREVNHGFAGLRETDANPFPPGY